VDENSKEEPAKDPVESVVELDIDVDDEGDLVVPLFKLVVARDAVAIPTVKLGEINAEGEGLALSFPELETAERGGGNEELMLPVVSPVASGVAIAVLELEIETADERREFPLVALTLGSEGNPVMVFVLDVREVDELEIDKYNEDAVDSETPLFAVIEIDDTPLLPVVEMVEIRPILDAAPDCEDVDCVVKGEDGTVLTDKIPPVMPVRILPLPEPVVAVRSAVERPATEAAPDELLDPGTLGPDRVFEPEMVNSDNKTLMLIDPVVVLNPDTVALDPDLLDPDMLSPDETEPNMAGDCA
jgi:hypothetical protein